MYDSKSVHECPSQEKRSLTLRLNQVKGGVECLFTTEHIDLYTNRCNNEYKQFVLCCLCLQFLSSLPLFLLIILSA